jgi:hypothetical protein
MEFSGSALPLTKDQKMGVAQNVPSPPAASLDIQGVWYGLTTVVVQVA